MRPFRWDAWLKLVRGFAHAAPLAGSCERRRSGGGARSTHFPGRSFREFPCTHYVIMRSSTASLEKALDDSIW